MSEYVFLYRNAVENSRPNWSSPEKRQQNMKKWRDWFEELGRKGSLKAIGQPLEEGGKVVGAKRAVTDGPYAETKDLIGGYSLIEAANLDEAAKIAQGCPILDSGGMVEVRPVMQM